ncbi:MAG: hypothetical protein ABSF29_10285 [Tepidisphaeraceae bacterium]|jgi:hypothetical protein
MNVRTDLGQRADASVGRVLWAENLWQKGDPMCDAIDSLLQIQPDQNQVSRSYEMDDCSTRGMAEELGNDEVAKLPGETVTEEGAADKKLKAIAQDEVFPQAAVSSHAAGVN